MMRCAATWHSYPPAIRWQHPTFLQDHPCLHLLRRPLRLLCSQDPSADAPHHHAPRPTPPPHVCHPVGILG